MSALLIYVLVCLLFFCRVSLARKLFVSFVWMNVFVFLFIYFFCCCWIAH